MKKKIKVPKPLKLERIPRECEMDFHRSHSETHHFASLTDFMRDKIYN